MDFPAPHHHRDPAEADLDDFDDDAEPELAFPEGDYRSTDV